MSYKLIALSVILFWLLPGCLSLTIQVNQSGGGYLVNDPPIVEEFVSALPLEV